MRRRHIEKFHSDEATGNFDYDDSKTFDENMLIYRSLLPDHDKKKFDAKRQSKYWLTFSICLLYGGLAIIILLLGSFTNWGNRLLFNELYMFVITFIIGTIIIILYLTYKVYSFDFPMLDKEMGYDTPYCPDYWNSSFTFTNTENGTDHDELDAEGKKKNYFGDKYNKSQFNLKCHIRPNSGIYTSTDLYNQLRTEKNYKQPNGNAYPHNSKLMVELEDKNSPNFLNKTGLNTETTEYNEFRKAAAKMSGYTYNIHSNGEEELIKNNSFALRDPNGNHYTNPEKIPLKCDTVYPLYLAKKDFDFAKQNKTDNYNKFRCAYSKTCGIPWTEAGCY